MPHEVVAPGTTFCADTPENWAHFYRLKARITGSEQSAPRKPKPKSERKPVIMYGYNTCKR